MTSKIVAARLRTISVASLPLAVGIGAAACSGEDFQPGNPHDAGSTGGAAGAAGSGGTGTAGSGGTSASGGTAGTSGTAGTGGAGSGGTGSKAQNGTACSSGDTCESGHCVDSVCCNTSCDGECETCTAAGNEGTCTPADTTTHACIPTVPAGWNGPIVWSSSGSSANCDTQYPQIAADLHGDLNVPQASCECECGTNTGACQPPRRVGYGSTCPQNPQGYFGFMTGGCQQATTTQGLEQPTPYQSVCPVSKDTATIPAANFKTDVRLCEGAAAATGCDSTKICAPKAAGPFKGQCIYKAGDTSCPAVYPTKAVYYDAFADTRSCSSCSCSSVGSACTSSVLAYQTANCTGTTVTHGLSSNASSPTCVPSNWIAMKWSGTSTFVAGSCQKSGGALSGSVTPSGAVTVCCL